MNLLLSGKKKVLSHYWTATFPYSIHGTCQFQSLLVVTYKFYFPNYINEAQAGLALIHFCFPQCPVLNNKKHSLC